MKGLTLPYTQLHQDTACPVCLPDTEGQSTSTLTSPRQASALLVNGGMPGGHAQHVVLEIQLAPATPLHISQCGCCIGEAATGSCAPAPWEYLPKVWCPDMQV